MRLEKVSRAEYDTISASFPKSFHQQSYWGEVKKETGEYDAVYYSIIQDDQIWGAFQVLLKQIKFLGFGAPFAYIPRGVFTKDIQKAFQSGEIAELVSLLKKEFLLLVLEFDVP